jgi:hypothetical protein
MLQDVDRQLGDGEAQADRDIRGDHSFVRLDFEGQFQGLKALAPHGEATVLNSSLLFADADHRVDRVKSARRAKPLR